METEETSTNEKNEKIFACSKCDFKCSYLSDWRRHLATRKHQMEIKWKQITSVNVAKNLLPILGYGNTKRNV